MTSSKIVNLKICCAWYRQPIDVYAANDIQQHTRIVDNAPAHAKLDNLVAEYDDVQLLRSTPYFYLLNLIELVLSSFKSYAKINLRE